MKSALAIFVKTPGFSPLKTRLASGIGTEKALEFYRLSLKATVEFASALKNLNPHLEIFWAVAEKEAMNSDFWSDFPVICQGSGTLGERLSSIYDKLLQEFGTVFFMGADSPHLNVQKIGMNFLQFSRSENEFLLGQTDDGGFYVFGGKRKLSKENWLSIEYSSQNTYCELVKVLEKFSPVKTLEKNFDIDYIDDLEDYSKDLFLGEDFLLSQKELVIWVRENILNLL